MRKVYLIRDSANGTWLQRAKGDYTRDVNNAALYHTIGAAEKVIVAANMRHRPAHDLTPWWPIDGIAHSTRAAPNMKMAPLPVLIVTPFTLTMDATPIEYEAGDEVRIIETTPRDGMVTFGHCYKITAFDTYGRPMKIDRTRLIIESDIPGHRASIPASQVELARRRSHRDEEFA